jgi:hypothetical protein
MCFSHGDAICKDHTAQLVWQAGKKFIIASEWFKTLVCKGLPFSTNQLAENRTLTVWGSGVDTDFFTTAKQEPKTQDYFLYFKSQKYNELSKLHIFLFNNYFKLAGTLLTYYHYDSAMLREAAQKSRFCIFLSSTETQCLAALEIMACDIPLFVIDATSYTIEDVTVPATSVTCWDERCGMKSTLETFEKDFPLFYERLETGVYKPREFVLENYSFEAASHKLRALLEA